MAKTNVLTLTLDVEDDKWFVTTKMASPILMPDGSRVQDTKPLNLPDDPVHCEGCGLTDMHQTLEEMNKYFHRFKKEALKARLGIRPPDRTTPIIEFKIVPVFEEAVAARQLEALKK